MKKVSGTCGKNVKHSKIYIIRAQDGKEKEEIENFMNE